jgi:arylsulfatase A-like enzyme
VISLLAVFAELCAVAAPAAEQPDKHNVLFILVDDMGWRDLACYGHEIHETPNIDKLASQGMRFTQGYAACPICGPSRAAIMTGKFPSRWGFVDNFISREKNIRQFLKLEEFTLAEALNEWKTGEIWQEEFNSVLARRRHGRHSVDEETARTWSRPDHSQRHELDAPDDGGWNRVRS